MKNPQVSILVLLAGAFTVFALSGGVESKRRKKPGMWKRLFSCVTKAEDASFTSKREHMPPTKEKSSGIVVLLEVTSHSVLFFACIDIFVSNAGPHLRTHISIVLDIAGSTVFSDGLER